MPANPETGSLAASIAINTRWARASDADRRQQSEAMMTGQDRRFARICLDPGGTLSEDELDDAIAATPASELAARIAAARKAHMLRASLAAAKARRKKAT